MSYTHFTLDERKYLQKLLAEGYSFRKIAALLGRSPSTVSREISRNKAKYRPSHTDNPYWYNSWRANCLATVRRRDKRRPAIPEGSPVWDFVTKKLQAYWSPEQIAAVWRIEHPESTLCYTTIYHYIHRGDLTGISSKNNLRRRGKNRHYNHSGSCQTIHPDRTVLEWTEEIALRSRIGDWEGDTVYGGVGKGLLVTLVDRKSRFLRAGLLKDRDASGTAERIAQLLSGLPVNSLSLDNGSEFSQFRKLEEDIQAPIYFAEPHKPWQRGTNENTNGILRFFFPKGFDFRTVDDSDIQFVVDLINRRARKCLGWKSPFDVFFGVALD